MAKRTRCTRWALTFVVLVGLGLPGSAVAKQPPAYFKDPLDRSTRQRPATISYKDVSLTRLLWTGWGQATTTAHGKVRLRVCEPTCANGRTVFGTATVTLYGLQRVGARRYYTCLKGTLAGLPKGLPAYYSRLRPNCSPIG